MNFVLQENESLFFMFTCCSAFSFLSFINTMKALQHIFPAPVLLFCFHQTHGVVLDTHMIPEQQLIIVCIAD
jgi:hypothetical protein